MLRYVIIFSAHLMMALKVQAQCESPAVGENRIMTEISDQQTFPKGYTVKFKCSTGYIPERTSASRTITCNGNQWSKLQLQCKKKSCGNPGEILNGKYLFPEGIQYGATIMAQCNEGYQLIGDSERNCREKGWDKRHPVCEVVKCINPPSVPDGVFEPEEEVYNYGDGVYYSCKRGLDLFGPSLLTCSNDGTFQPAPPRCLFVTCERPEILHAVRIEGKSAPYKYRDFVRYRCNEGYKMEGSDFLICKEDGWDPPPPQCTIVTCSPPTLIHNGQFNPQKKLYEYGNRVTFRCNEGFKLKGPASSLCTEHGIFHPSPPQCEEIFCDPQTIQNAVIVGNSSLYRYNDSVQIRCNEGYKTVGSDRLTCGVNGWSPGFSPCTVVTCERPEILNAVRIGGKWPPYKYRDFVRYRCNEGYKMEGSDRMICKEDGWDPPPPQCTIVTCSPPTLIHNGQFNPQKKVYEYGNSVKFTCNGGFKLKGSANSSCTEDGIFKPSPPQCEVVTCERPKILNAVRIEGKWPPYKYSDFVSYRCNKGYKMEGSDRIICKEDGWDPPPPQCTIVTCSPPPLIHNGQFNPQKELYKYGNRVTFTCNEGFKLKGPASSLCTIDGIFQPSPQCQAQCVRPNIEENRILAETSRQDNFPDGSTLTYKCSTGYVPKQPGSSNSITCKGNQWTELQLQCKLKSCGSPGEIPHGKYLTPDGILFGATATAQCDEGYMLVGERTRNCQDNGWDGRDPVCEVKSCGNPGDISHGKYLTTEGILFGATITAQCDEGYTLVGERTRNCRDDGWDGRDPVCEEVKCKPPPSIQNGSFEPMDEVYYYYNQSVTYSCNKNYTLIGASVVSCSDNGTFPPPPLCSIPDTKLIPVLVNVSSSVPPTEQTTPKTMD